MNMITHTADNPSSQPYRHAHPSPVHIKVCIFEAFLDDVDNEDTPPIPFHAMRLVREGIARACKEHDAEVGQ